MGTAITVITIAAVAALSAFILWFFFSPGKAGHAAVEGKRQVAQITVKGADAHTLAGYLHGLANQLSKMESWVQICNTYGAKSVDGLKIEESTDNFRTAVLMCLSCPLFSEESPVQLCCATVFLFAGFHH